MIKQKLVNGKVYSGIVDSKLNEAVSFEYDKIERIEYNIFACYKNGKPTIIKCDREDNVIKLIEIDDEIQINTLVGQYENDAIVFIASKGEDQGIIEVKVKFSDKNKTIVDSSTYRVLYDFKHGIDIWPEHSSSDYTCKLEDRSRYGSRNVGLFKYNGHTGNEYIIEPCSDLDIKKYYYKNTYNTVTLATGRHSSGYFVYQIDGGEFIKIIDSMYSRISIWYTESKDDCRSRMTGTIVGHSYYNINGCDIYGFCYDEKHGKLYKVFKENAENYDSYEPLKIVRNKDRKFGIIAYELESFNLKGKQKKPKEGTDYIFNYLVPIEYDSLKLVHRAIIGKKGDHKDLILYTKKPYEWSADYHKKVFENYIDIKQLNSNVYACTKENKRIDIIKVCKDLYRPEEINDIDFYMAKDIDSYVEYHTFNDNYVVTQKDGKYNIFSGTKPFDFSTFGLSSDDILTIKVNDDNKLFTIVFNNGTLLLCSGSNFIYSTTLDGLSLEDITFKYDSRNSFLVVRKKDNISVTQVGRPYKASYEFLFNRTFSNFVFNTSYVNYHDYMIFGYTELNGDKEVSTLSQVKIDNVSNEQVLLQGEFKIESDIVDKTCILSKIDPSTGTKVYGVYSFGVSKMSIDFGLINIEPQYHDGEVEYICTLPDGNVITLDKDGFVVVKEESGNQRNRTDR